MLKTLVKKQFREIGKALFPMRKGKNGKIKNTRPLYIAIYAFALFSVMATFFGLAAGLAIFLDPEAGLSSLYFSIIGLIAIFFGVFGSVFSTYASLYLAKDNETLLAMPIPSSMILLSRMIPVFVMGAVYVLPAWLPGMIVYTATVGFSPVAFLCQILVGLFICLFVCFLSALLGFFVAIIASRLKNKSVAAALSTIVFFALYYCICFRAGFIITSIREHGSEINAFLASHLPFLTWLGDASCGKGLALLFFALVVIALFAALYYVLSKTFLSISTRKVGEKKAVYREKETRAGSVSSALFKKELKRFVGSTAYLLNAGIGVLLVPIFTVVILIKKSAIISIAGQNGITFLLPLIAYALPAMMLGMNAITAPSISLEGKTLWQIKSLPVTSWQILRAKLLLQFVVNAPFGFVSAFLFGGVFFLDFGSSLLVALCVLAVIALSALWGLFWGVKKPMLDWTNETVPIKQSISVLLSVFGAFGFVAYSTAIAAFFVTVFKSLPAIAFLLLLCLILIPCIPLYRWLKTKGTRVFEEL